MVYSCILKMKKAMRFMSLLVLIVFLGSNFLTPISYAMDESWNTIDASSEDSSTEESGSNSEDSVVSEEENTNPESITDTEEDSDENSNEDNNDENIVMVEDYTPNQSVISGDVTEEITEDIDSNIQEETQETQEIQEEINYNKYWLASLANKLWIDWDNEKEIYAKLAGIEDNYQWTREQNEKIREWLIDNSEKIKEYNAIKAKTDSNNTVLDAAKFFHKRDNEEGVLTDAPSSFFRENNEVLEQSLTWEVEETEIDIAWKTLNKDSIIESKNFRSLWIKVKVEALSWTFPEWTYAEISSVYWEEYENAKQKIIDDPENNVTEEDEMFTFDIKFLYKLSSWDVIEVQPKENKVQVTFDYDKNDELKQADTTEEQEIQIYHINDKDEKWEKVEEWEEVVEKIEINEGKSEDINNGVVIDAESFSYYTIVVQRREETLESTPTQTWQYGEDYFTISIARPSSLDNDENYANHPWITIMDRNLWATATWYGDSNTASTDSYGYLYQWWNNYWFPYSAASGDILTGVGLQWNDSYNDMWYVSKKFVNWKSFNNDVWNNSGHYDDVWWWTGDNSTNWWWAKLTNYEERQWPCPEWWHVPSVWEWWLLIKYWDVLSGNNSTWWSNWLFYLNSNYSAFQEYFKLPFAGGRDYSTADLSYLGSLGSYWSSSPNSAGSTHARLLDLSSSHVRASSYGKRATGLSVRCFRDSYVASPETSNLVDTQAWVKGKDFETITISNPENSNEWFTIMDRNLWASISWTVCDKTNDTWACGFLYQWWNNYWFPITETVTPVTTWLTWNNVYNNHGYFSTNFINWSSHDYDVWDGTNPTANDKEHHDWVWWWANDDQSANNWWLDSNNPTDRQWPCPVWYHIPSAWEWSKIFEYWCKKNPSKCDMDNMHEEVWLYYNYNDQDIGTNFAGDLKLPFAGYRIYSTADLKHQGSFGLYWSSSPHSAGSNLARLLNLDSSYVRAVSSSRRAIGLSVRCFKDSYVAPKTYTLTFDSQGGSEVTSQTVVEGQTRSRPAQNPTKTNWTFDNWYTSTWYTAPFDFSAPAYANTTAYAKWNDGKAPSNVSVTTTSNEKATSQTATLSCTDEIWVTKYYWWTSSSPNDSAYTPVTSTTNFSTTQPVSSAWTYYLLCKDAAWNTGASVSKAYYTYSVQNMLDKVAWTQWTHNTTNYETNGNSMWTYIIPSGTTITLNSASLYWDPISSHDTYAWYTTSNSGTPTTSNPTITLNTTYYRWYNRDSHTLTLNKWTWISSVSGAWTIKHWATANIDATVTNGYTWVNWTKTSWDTPASATNKATTVVITQDTVLTANASDQTAPVCTITAQPTRTSMSLVAGYNQWTVTFTCTDSVGVATSNLSASNITYNSDIVTLSNFTAWWTATSKTFTFTYSASAAGSTTFTLKAWAVSDAEWNPNAVTSATNTVTVDTTAPTITITEPNAWTWTQSKSVTASVNDGTLTMKESTSSTCNSSVEGFVSYADKNYISESDNWKYICYKAVDNVWNTSYLSSAKVEKIDRTAPILSEKTTYNTSWYTSNQTSTFTYTDAWAGINEWYNTDECTISTEWTASTCQITPNICDKVGNCNTTKQTSNSIKLDKTAPTFKEKTTYNTSWYNTPQQSIFTYEDTVSWIDGTTTTSCTINEEWTTATCTVANTNICNNAWLCNTTNLTSNSIKLDTTKPTCKIEWNPSTPTNQNVNLRVVYLSEVNQITDGYSWDNETYSNTQIRNVSANGTYTAYVKDAAWNTWSCSVTVDKIDKVLPIITINNPTTTPAQSKTITASTNEWTLYMAQTNNNTDCKVGSSLEFGDYASLTFGLEANNGTYVCYKAIDAAWNVKYELSDLIAWIDTTWPILGFSANVLAWPVKSNTVTATWWDATVKKWMYSNTSTCSNTESDYNKTDSDSMNQTTQANNGKYICLYAKDSAWNVSKLASANPINIDITDPTCSISWNPENYTNQNVTLTVTMTDTNIDNNGYTWNDGLYSDNKNLTVSSNGTYTAHVRDLAGNTWSCSVTVTKIDKTNPVASIDTTATLKSASQTATLSCTDSVGIAKYYRWITSNPEDSEFIILTESTTEFSTTKTVNEAGTYYLLCKDTAWNISNSASKTYHSYEVHNMLNAVDKAEWTYNTTNYPQNSVATYLAPAWTTITFAKVYSLPTYSTGDQYVWYTTSASWTPSNDANVLLNDNSTYYFWFNRVKHALTLQMSTGIEHIYYKINSGSEYVVSETTSVQMKEWSDAYAYATASAGYQLTSAFENYNTDTPKTWNTITAQQVFAPLATKRTDLSYRIKYQNSAWTSISWDVLVENQTFGDEVTVLPWEIAWYITPLSKDITIAVTNPDVIFVYTPKEDIVYTVTYKDTNGNSLLTTKTVNTWVMDTEVTENAPEIDWYTAQTGTLSITLKATNNHIDFVYNPNNNITYTVKYMSWAVSITGDKVVENQTMATTVSEDAEVIPWYTVITWSKELKLAANNNVITFDYTPNEYVIRFVDWSGSYTPVIRSWDYLSVVNQNPPTWTKAWYTIHWDKSIPETMPLNGETITATWTANTYTTYKVKHWKQNIEDDEYTEIIADEEHPTWTTAQQTAAVAKPYVWFTAKAFNQETIAWDESTVVNIYYDRIKSNVSYNYTNDPAIEWAPALPATAEYKYGAEVDVAVLPSLAGYTFSNSWNAEWIVVNEWKFVMPANEVEFTGTWTANNYTITFNANGHWTAPEAITQAYKTTVTVPAEPEVAGYTFGGWYTEAECENEYEFTTMPLNGKVLYAKWTANTNTVYKVEYYQQNIENDEYSFVETWIQYGTSDTKWIAIEKSYVGFTFSWENENTVTSWNIAWNWSLVLKMYYDRNSYDVSYSYTNNQTIADAPSLPSTVSYKYGAEVDVAVLPSLVGYTFSNSWNAEWIVVNEWKFIMPANEVEFTGTWTANTNTAYKIEHYKEKLDWTYEKVETEEKTGKTDTTATATPKTDYEGFTYNWDVEWTKVSGNIAWNGSLVLKLFYTRNSYDVEYQFANTPNGHSTLPATVSHKYWATVDIAANATAPWYSFAWNRTESFEMPAEDVVITGIFTANTTTPYKVEYYYQQANGEYPTTATSTDTTRKWTTDQTASVTNEDKTPTESWYAFDDANTNNVLEWTIAWNESLVLKVYFKKQFTVRYLTGERWTFEIQTTNNIDYGTFTPNFEWSTDNHEDWYMFAGWAPNKAATVTESVDYVAQWYEDFNHNNQNDAYEDKYTVIITYVYSRWGIAAQTYSVSNQLSWFTYNVDSPDIPNYHADKTNVSGTITGDVNVTITYTPNNDTNGNEIADEDETKHKITVYYNYSRWGIASETQSWEYLSWINYSFTSPDIDYYTPNTIEISGTTTWTVSFTVIYSPLHDVNNNKIADEQETPFTVTFLPWEHGTLWGTTEYSVFSWLKLSDIEWYQTPTTTANTHYVFSWWSPSLNTNSKVLSDVTYTAIWWEDNNNDGQNDEFETKYTVTYRDWVDGSVFEEDIHTNILSWTTTPTHTNPTRLNYVFSGWTPSIAEKVTANAIYTATWKVDSNNNWVADEDETYILTINYVYSKWWEAAATHSESILQGAQYSVVSPNIANYQTTDTTVSWTMPWEHTTITVIYTPITDVNHNDIADEEEAKYTLTIQYQDTKWNTVYDDYTAQYVSWASYEKASQTKEHYTIISWENVSWVMPADNLTLTVIYSANLDANDNGIADQNETHYTLTIHYVNAQNGTLYPDYSWSYVAWAEYIIASNTSDTNYTIESWKEIVNWIMPVQNTAITVTYTAKNDANGNGVADEDEPHHTLTIHYKNSKWSTVFPDHTESVVEWASYIVNSPEKTHYTIDKPIVSWTMGEENITVTVTYNTTTADTNNNWVADEDETAHQLTINYNYSRGGQASETVTANYLSWINYSVISPIIANYTANIATVEWIMWDADKTINVIYTPDVDNNNNGIADALDSKYTATVHYVYSRGWVAHADKTQQDILSGLNYSITSPTIAHYTPNRQTVSWTITGDNVEVTVTYTPVTDVNGDGYADEDETKYTVIYTDWVVDVVVFADKVFSNILSWTITPTYNGSLIRTDYLFSWWTPSVATKVIWNATYTAQWKEDMNNNGIDDDTEDKYTITIKDWETIISTQEIVSWAKINLPAIPTKDGYVFDGWDWLPDDGKATNENLTITVKWKKVEILPVDNTPRAWGGGGRIISNNTSSSNTTTNEHGSAEEKTWAVNTWDVKNTDDKNISDILNTHTDSENTGQTNTTSPVDSNIESNEVTDAYTWAHNNRITTMPSIEEATPDGYVKRWHLAKMLVNYSVNVLWKKIPAIPKECKNWSDDKDFESDEIRDYAEKACALWLMWVDTENHKFNPNQEVTRAQLGTTISRMLYGDKFQWGFPYYEKHLKILNQKNIMKNVENPQDRIELRKWVWIMLMRVKDLEKN